MTYETGQAFRAALEQRLKDRATVDGAVDAARLNRLRKRVTFERFLVRLVAVAPKGWVLKGGLALEFRLGDVARSTKDMDIDWALAEREALSLLQAAAALDKGDYFRFRVERGRSIEPENQGQRWRLTAELDGREFEAVLIDVSVGVEPILEMTTLSLPITVDIAGEPGVEIPALPLEQHLAEKVHAYSRRYGVGAQPSSRVKDLVDMALVASLFELESVRFKLSLAEVFDRRSTHDLPVSLIAPPSDWRPAWRGLAVGLPIPEGLDAGHELAGLLINPVLGGRAEGWWSPDASSWGAKDSLSNSAPHGL